jgi:opacity protein-like surface antigen
MFLKSAATLAILCGVAASAAAQAKPTQPRPVQPSPTRPRPSQPIDRIYVSINGTYQTAGDDFTETATFTENAENGSFSSDYDVKPGPALNISAGATIWRSLGVGVGVTRYSKATPIAFSASVPHPFFFNRARSVTADISSNKREELAVHVQARAVFTPSRRIQALIFAGPSFFKVKQGIVNDFEITESYPFDSATFSRGISTEVDESKVGFNVGADVGYFFTRQVGVGGSVQWAGTTIEVPASGTGTGTFEIKAGGVQAGGGLRFRF